MNLKASCEGFRNASIVTDRRCRGDQNNCVLCKGWIVGHLNIRLTLNWCNFYFLAKVANQMAVIDEAGGNDPWHCWLGLAFRRCRYASRCSKSNRYCSSIHSIHAPSPR